MLCIALPLLSRAVPRPSMLRSASPFHRRASRRLTKPSQALSRVAFPRNTSHSNSWQCLCFAWRCCARRCPTKPRTAFAVPSTALLSSALRLRRLATPYVAHLRLAFAMRRRATQCLAAPSLCFAKLRFAMPMLRRAHRCTAPRCSAQPCHAFALPRPALPRSALHRAAMPLLRAAVPH